jgi:hypothetical protein
LGIDHSGNTLPEQRVAVDVQDPDAIGVRHISTSGMSKSLFGEELYETGGDCGGIPARQVVASSRYRHRVDFCNPLLQ